MQRYDCDRAIESPKEGDYVLYEDAKKRICPSFCSGPSGTWCSKLDYLYSILTEYLSYDSIDGNKKRQELRDKLKAVINDS